jgi:hypothetical protein
VPHIPISPPESFVPPPLYQKLPIIRVYTRRSTAQPHPPPLTSPPASPATSAPDNTNNSDELQVHPRYQLHDRTTMVPLDLYGFPRADAVIVEPSNYQEASRIPEWQLAMTEELAALDRAGTWDIVPLPSHAVPITCKWVFKVKTKSDGSIERYKAHPVARGFQQTQGRDYDETFAPVAHMTTIRTMITVAATRSWTIH